MPTFTDLTDLAARTGVSKRELDRIVRRLVRLYDPLRVYLFGSFAWGIPHWNSDLDFCVVVETDEQAKDKSKGRSVFYRLLHTATDFYLLSQGEFEKMISNPASMEHKIHHEATVLYSKSNVVFDENKPLHREEHDILREAQDDLGAANVLKTPFPNKALFHVQQCMEHSFRAFWSFHLRSIIKMHELGAWRRLCGKIEPAILEIEGIRTKKDADRLSEYYWLRYGRNVAIPADMAGVEAEIAIAERVYQFMKHYIETTEPPAG